MYLTTIIIYLILLIGIGAIKSGKVKTRTDFAIAGRSLTPIVLTGTMIATWIGTGSIFGNAGKTFHTGIAALFIPAGSLLGIMALIVISSKVRNLNVMTVPEIIGNRFGRFPRQLAALALVIAYMVIVSYQYNAGGAVLQVVLTDGAGNPLVSGSTAVMIAAAFIITYTLLAGLFSVAYTDVANSVVIILTFIISFPILWFKAGGLTGIETLFSEAGRSSHMQLFGVFTTKDFINFCLPPFLLILGDANMYQRFSAGETAKSVRKATIWFIFGVMFVEWLIILTAWVGSSMIPDVENGRHVIIYVARNLLPPFLGATLITTIVGIVISTADSYLLVSATTVVEDVYLKYIRPESSEKTTLLMNRLAVLLLGIIAWFISMGFSESAGFFERALYAYTIYGAGITPALLATMFWKGATRQGVIVSILTGVIVTLLWKEWGVLHAILPQSLFALDEVLPAAFASTSMLIGVSLLTKREK